MLLLEGTVSPEFLCREPEDVVLLKSGWTLSHVGRQSAHRLGRGEVPRNLGVGDQRAVGYLQGQLFRFINNERAFVVIRIGASPIDQQLRLDTGIPVNLSGWSKLARRRSRGRCNQQAGERHCASGRDKR